MSSSPSASRHEEPAPGEEGRPRFMLRNVFLKDISFQAPNVPGVLYREGLPEFKFDVSASHRLSKVGLFHVFVRLQVRADVGDQNLFTAEVVQGGVFEISGYSEEETSRLLAVRAPESIYPFAREFLNSLVSRCGFANLALTPVNFAAIRA